MVEPHGRVRSVRPLLRSAHGTGTPVITTPARTPPRSCSSASRPVPRRPARAVLHLSTPHTRCAGCQQLSSIRPAAQPACHRPPITRTHMEPRNSSKASITNLDSPNNMLATPERDPLHSTAHRGARSTPTTRSRRNLGTSHSTKGEPANERKICGPLSSSCATIHSRTMLLYYSPFRR